ncbi:MAG: DUF47 domain-containing protein [Thermoplasmata archaeon]
MRIFKKKNDLKILENYVLQTEKVKDGSRFLIEVYDDLLNLNYDKLDEVTKKIENIRSDVIAISKENELNLYKGILFPTDKYIFVTLTESIERVMEKIIQTVRAIYIRPMPLPGVNFLKDINFKNYLEDTIRTTDLLYDATKSLFNDEKNTVDICHSISDLEQKIDDIKLKMLKDLHKMEKELEVFTILQIENIIHRIDEISDSAEDASDIIILMHSLQSE